MTAENRTKVAQEEAAKAREGMLQILIGFEPAQNLRVSDIKFIAGMAQTLAFDATEPFRSGDA